jgi:hypothetical protein
MSTQFIISQNVTAPSSLTIEWLRSPAEIASISGEWTALESAVRQRTVLSTFDFLVTWYRHQKAHKIDAANGQVSGVHLNGRRRGQGSLSRTHDRGH